MAKRLQDISGVAYDLYEDVAPRSLKRLVNGGERLVQGVENLFTSKMNVKTKNSRGPNKMVKLNGGAVREIPALRRGPRPRAPKRGAPGGSSKPYPFQEPGWFGVNPDGSLRFGFESQR